MALLLTLTSALICTPAEDLMFMNGCDCLQKQMYGLSNLPSNNILLTYVLRIHMHAHTLTNEVSRIEQT